MRPLPRSCRVVLLLCAGLLLAACTSDDGSAGGSAGAPATSPATGAAPATEEPLRSSRPALWLCRPGLRASPCEGDLDTTVVAADGSRAIQPFRPARRPAFDCFYVYPTVSTAMRTNAPRRVTPELVEVVRSQAALFARECRLYAPVYRQVTLQGLITGGFTDPAARALALSDVTAAWQEYLDRWNDGRPFLLLGHSQGAFALTSLIEQEIDDDPALREQMVSAILPGGSVTTAQGEDAGGSFDNVPACRSDVQTGCVVAYNTFTQQPPELSIFGRAGEGEQVLCVNPAAPGGGRASLTPYLPVQSPDDAVTGFTAYEDAVTASCRTADGASWLQARSGGSLPSQLSDTPLGLAWGLHRLDVNIALGDLVDLAASQADALR